MQIQEEFEFVKDIECKAHEATLEEEEDLAECAYDEFLILMNKYSISEEDIERIQLLAKFC